MAPTASPAARAALAAQVRAQYPSDDTRAREFMMVARTMARFDQPHEVDAYIQRRGLPTARKLVERAAGAATLDDPEVWGSETGRELAAHYVQSVAETDALSLLSRYATVLPSTMRTALIASGYTAGTVVEGMPKAVRRPLLDLEQAPEIKAIGLMVLSAELLESTEGTARQLFEQELQRAVTRAANSAAAAAFDSQVVAGGSDAVEDLQIALTAAGDSAGFVVLCAGDVLRELSVMSDGRVGVRGGEWAPGIHLLAVEADTDTPRLTVLPASRCAMSDLGLSVASARHASVHLSDDPAAPGDLTSLWQTNARGLLVERRFRLVADASAVVIA